MSQPQPGTSHLNLRAQVIRTLLAVHQGQSLASVLPIHLQKVADRDRALFHELVLGSLRQWYSLKSITLPLLTKSDNNETVETCMYVGIYQLLCTRLAPHGVISETVEAVKQLGYGPLSGLVNAVLRRVSRETTHFQEELAHAHGLPSWLFKRLKKDWGEETLEKLCWDLKQIAPLTLRVNDSAVSRGDFLDILTEHNIAARACELSDVGIVLEQAVQIPNLPGFEDGGFSVQDEHAQLCAQILPNLDGKVVVDACAAPGGKTAHLLERFDLKKLYAIDQDSKRLLRVSENLERLQLTQHADVEILTADATNWITPEPVDCIVLDAPCSAIGVMRRHPDIRLLRQSSDIAQTVALQKEILQHMWQQVKAGGHLLYITCSILKVENEQQMVDFFATHEDAQEIKIDANWGIEQIHGRQLLPQQGKGDGFYYCLIQKTA
ncbi:16S rRNA (cytosine(967)-C(5))-methyltransferase RsmB [Acinetobacter sp. FL51]|jgi:16S rRNA (cytosine967-C5)-methyltransferase|uniref:16S rRNA (cytosine(967)-C(5))-methyltransferase RsmB n=1 Tax=Acinetobacter sp. FL51 TaxID=2777978 RepID=UPI0018E1A6F9|nr:16S rRNA (cytosine(967)-C(5))-methyltransferase RsmB [Acinetobacter sp. FL51]MBI1452562.1 16S rRNA (cytosine(967)-C(5))-methyltransferase RsmB [Acinetobacter sp. FL51]